MVQQHGGIICVGFVSEMSAFSLCRGSGHVRENRDTEHCTFQREIMRLSADAAGGPSHTVSLFSLQRNKAPTSAAPTK